MHLTRFAYDRGAENEELIGSLLPFDGCSIIAPEEWLEKIRRAGSVGKLDKESVLPLQGGPRDMILSILEDDPVSKKKDVKSQIMSAFPAVSNRKFDQYWASVAEEKPYIQLPGRKSTRRIETLY
ncbi:hypothetical protein AJ87_02770 [Rhizobium yanglingense]|nr:hypothetical protein AJ87_02770 [Rhizobium yanglingense]